MDRTQRKQLTTESLGREIANIKNRRTYRLDSFNADTGECVLIPTQPGGRTTRKSYLNLWLDYEPVQPDAASPTPQKPSKPLWTVARFPDGSWSTGGRPDEPDYACCTVFQVEAFDRDEAKRKGQAEWRKLQRRNAR